jgi:hypothetical protein
VTIAIRPSGGVGWREFVEMICPTGEAKYFCKQDSTSKSPDSLSGKSAGQAIRPARGNLKIVFSICRAARSGNRNFPTHPPGGGETFFL